MEKTRQFSQMLHLIFYYSEGEQNEKEKKIRLLEQLQSPMSCEIQAPKSEVVELEFS